MEMLMYSYAETVATKCEGKISDVLKSFKGTLNEILLYSIHDDSKSQKLKSKQRVLKICFTCSVPNNFQTYFSTCWLCKTVSCHYMVIC